MKTCTWKKKKNNWLTQQKKSLSHQFESFKRHERLVWMCQRKTFILFSSAKKKWNWWFYMLQKCHVVICDLFFCSFTNCDNKLVSIITKTTSSGKESEFIHFLRAITMHSNCEVNVTFYSHRTAENRNV